MDFVFKFNLPQRNFTYKQLLPNMKNFGCFPVKMIVNCPSNEIVVKLFSDDKSILTLNESVFYETTSFDLIDYKLPITTSNNLNLSITHMSENKDKRDISGEICFKYGRLDGYIIYSNTLTQTKPDDLSSLSKELQKYCKYAQKIVWSSPKGLLGIEFIPEIQSIPDGYFKSYTFNTLIRDNDRLPPTNSCLIEQIIDENSLYFIQNLKHYRISLIEDDKCPISKLGIHVYGFFEN